VTVAGGMGLGLNRAVSLQAGTCFFFDAFNRDSAPEPFGPGAHCVDDGSCE